MPAGSAPLDRAMGVELAAGTIGSALVAAADGDTAAVMLGVGAEVAGSAVGAPGDSVTVGVAGGVSDGVTPDATDGATAGELPSDGTGLAVATTVEVGVGIN